jgi:hypothetical protein
MKWALRSVRALSAIANYTFEGTITAPNLIAAPEPDSLVLLGTGLLMMIMVTSVRRRFC